MAAPASPETDPELQEAGWDLEPLVAGEGEEGVERRMGEALERSKTFAEAHAGKLAELDAAGLRGRDGRAGRDPRAASAARATTPRCASRPTPPTPPTAR